MPTTAALTETNTGEPGAVKIACPVRRGAVGKGPDLGHLAGGLPSGSSEFAVSPPRVEDAGEYRRVVAEPF